MTIPLFQTKEIISAHDVCFGLLFQAVRVEQLRVLGYLSKAEEREQDIWAQQDYRTAQLVLILADEGARNPYSKAFHQLFEKNAHEVRHWWRERDILWSICERGGCVTPLLRPDLAERIIPDYDPTLQVSSGGAHAEREFGEEPKPERFQPASVRRMAVEAEKPFQSGPLESKTESNRSHGESGGRVA